MPDEKKKYPPGKHPNQLAGLRPWPKGVSGNPAGKPKGTVHLTTMLKRYLECKGDFKMPDGSKRKLKYGEGIVLKLITKALKGDNVAIREIYDRLEGRPTGDFDPGAKQERQFIKFGETVVEF